MTNHTCEAVCSDFHSIDLILLDDDKLTLEIVSWILKGSAISNHLFTDPGLAMDCLKNNTPRILVVDYYMPGINGVEFLEKCVADQNLTNTDKFLCTSTVPRGDSLSVMQQLGVQLIEKQVICDRSTLFKLVDQKLVSKQT